MNRGWGSTMVFAGLFALVIIGINSVPRDDVPSPCARAFPEDPSACELRVAIRRAHEERHRRDAWVARQVLP